MCQYCKTFKPVDTVDLVRIYGSSEQLIRTGIDLHEVPNPKFEFIGAEQSFTRHAVGVHWMREQLPFDANNKMLYHIHSDSSAGVSLFGAVYDSIAYLFIVKLDTV